MSLVLHVFGHKQVFFNLIVAEDRIAYIFSSNSEDDIKVCIKLHGNTTVKKQSTLWCPARKSHGINKDIRIYPL